MMQRKGHIQNIRGGAIGGPAHRRADIADVPFTAAGVEKVAVPVEIPFPPVEKRAVPVEMLSPPVENVSAPVETASLPVEKVSGPVETAAPPVEMASGPVETTSPPVEKGPRARFCVKKRDFRFRRPVGLITEH